MDSAKTSRRRIVGDYPQEVAERLNELLKLTGKKKADVARCLGRFQGSLTPWFSGRYSPRPETYSKLGRCLDPGWGSAATARYIQTGYRPDWCATVPIDPGEYMIQLRELQETIASIRQRLDGVEEQVQRLIRATEDKDAIRHQPQATSRAA